MNHEALIQKYLKTKLTAVEQVEFDRLLQSDPAFAEKVKEHGDLKNAIHESERAALKSQLFNLEKSYKKPARKRQIWWFAAAASVLLIIGIFTFLNSDSAESETLFAEHFKPYPNALRPVVRGEKTTDLEATAFFEYETGNFFKAAEILEQITSEIPDPDLKFYEAMSLMNAKNFTKAYFILKDESLENSKFYPQVLWYRALLKIRVKDYKPARADLQKLLIEQSEFKEKEARRLLKYLN